MIELVSRTGIAKRLRISPRRVQSWVESAGGGSEFPGPVARAGTTELWDWAAVARWAGDDRADAVDSEQVESAPEPKTASRHEFRLDVRRPADLFIGRQREMAELRALLDSRRIVTLVGPPGVGKTRLALEVAKATSHEWSCPTWFVPLAEVRDPGLVGLAVCSAIGTVPQACGDPAEAVAAIVGQRRALILLDGCEHLTDGCATFAQAVAAASPEVRLLATSRSPLDASGEQTQEVPCLSVCPCAGGSEAERLFRARAPVELPETDQMSADITKICSALDGVPLAIELAASWTKVLTPFQVAQTLGDRLRLPTDSRERAGAHHETLSAAIDWSYQLLPAPEQALLRRLSIFDGGCSVDAVQSVCVGNGVEAEMVLDGLTSLVSRSLVVSVADGGPMARYHLLATVRDYAGRRLAESGESATMTGRHSVWCCALGEAAESHLTGAHQSAWLDRLAVEHDNLRATLRRLLDDGSPQTAIRLAAALTTFWRLRGHLWEGYSWLKESLAAASDEELSDQLRAKALLGVGVLGAMAGRDEEGRRALDESAGLAHRIGDASVEARARLSLGAVANIRNDVKEALRQLTSSTELAQGSADTWALTHSLALIGQAHFGRDDFLAARPVLEECVAVARGCADLQGLCLGTLGVGACAFQLGDYRSAEGHLEEALAIAQELGDRFSIAGALTALGSLAIGLGHYDRASGFLQGAMSAQMEAHNASGSLLTLCLLGRLSFAQAAFGAAQEYLDAAASFGEAHRVASPVLPWAMGYLALATGDTTKARSLLDEALAAAQQGGQRSTADGARFGLACVDRQEGDFRRASALHHDVLERQHRAGELAGVARSLEALGGVAAALTHFERAARLLGAADSIRLREGYTLFPVNQPTHESDVALVRKSLGADRAGALWAEGAALSTDEAVSYAGRRHGKRARDRPPSGWSSLTKSERGVVELVAEGLSNAQVAERLFVSVRTVTSHLQEVYSKLGIRSRTELVRQMLDDEIARPSK